MTFVPGDVAPWDFDALLDNRGIGVMVPVATGAYFPNGAQLQSTSAPLQMGSFSMHWAPNGIDGAVQFVYAGQFVTPDETDSTIAVPINLGIIPNSPPPYRVDTNYVIDDTVTYGRQVWKALVPNVGILPGPSTSTTWATISYVTPQPATFKGTRAGRMPAATTPSAGTVVENVATDILPCDIPEGGYLGASTYIAQPSGNNRINLGRATKIIDGEYQFAGPSVGDRSIANPPIIPVAAQQGLNSMFAPAVILGIPKNRQKWAWVLAGDSTGDGITAQGAAAIALGSGGVGFTQNDVYRIGTVGVVGASAGAVNRPIRVMIGQVTGDAVSILWELDGGSMTNLTNQPSQTLPLLAQSVSFPGAAGSGVTVTWTLGATVDVAGRDGAQGAWQRAMIANRIVPLIFARGSDSYAKWEARSYSRMALMRLSNITAALDTMGLNDLPTDTAAQIITKMRTRAAGWRAGGAKQVIKSTLSPYVTVSNDGFLTPGGQTLSPYADKINTVNVEIRAGNVGNDGYIDNAEVVCTTPTSNIWKSDGTTVGLWTIDGIHDSDTGVEHRAAALTPLIAVVNA